MKHKITEIQIIPIKPRNGLIAFASVLLNESLFLSSNGIHSKLDGSGYRLTYPTKLVGDNSVNIYHPINKQLSKMIEEAVITKFKNVMKKVNDRYHSFNIS
jgi:stage V sporulation protein G